MTTDLMKGIVIMKRTQKTTTKLNKKEMKTGGNLKKSLAMKARWAAINQRTPEAVQPEVQKANDAEGLSVKDICAIISLCERSNILSFQFGALRLLFKKSIDVPKIKRSETVLNPSAPLKGALKGRTKHELQGLSDIASEELELLKITDPLGYEEFIQSEDAFDDGHSGT